MSDVLNHLPARWRLGLRLARRDARRHVGRTALLAVMVAFPVLAGTAALTALESSKDSPESVRVESLGPDLQASLIYQGAGPVQQTFDATNATWNSGPESGERPTRAEREIVLGAALPPGDRLVPVETNQIVLHAGELHLTSRMSQTDLSDPDVLAAFKLREGAAPGPREIAISGGVANQLGVAVGDTVEVEVQDGGTTETRQISGLLARHLPKNAGAVVHTDPENVSSSLLAVPGWGEVGWFVSGPTPVTWDDVLRLNEHGVAVISQEVLTNLPPLEDETLFRPGDGGPHADEVALGGAITIIAVLEGILIVGPAFAVGARRQERSLALAAAQGAPPRTLRALALAPAIAIGLGASVIGALLGIAVAAVPIRHFELPSVIVPWPRIAGMVLIGLVVAVAAAWMPARAAARLDVVATLSGRRRTRPVRGWAVMLGVLLAGAGLAGAFAAAIGDSGILLAWCIVVAEIGLVMTTGGIVTGLAKVSGRLPLSARFALRDAARHRSRTSPAVAAVLVAVAGATAGLVYLLSAARRQERLNTLATTVEHGDDSETWTTGALVIALIAVVVALVVAWLAAGLAAAESRPDLATLEAVGAVPWTRRTIVAAQAGAISVVGTVLGLGAGGVLGAALVQLEGSWTPATVVGAWTVEIPWLWLTALALVIPVLAIAAAWLVARPRPLLARRPA